MLDLDPTYSSHRRALMTCMQRIWEIQKDAATCAVQWLASDNLGDCETVISGSFVKHLGNYETSLDKLRNCKENVLTAKIELFKDLGTETQKSINKIFQPALSFYEECLQQADFLHAALMASARQFLTRHVDSLRDDLERNMFCDWQTELHPKAEKSRYKAVSRNMLSDSELIKHEKVQPLQGKLQSQMIKIHDVLMRFKCTTAAERGKQTELRARQYLACSAIVGITMMHLVFVHRKRYTWAVLQKQATTALKAVKDLKVWEKSQDVAETDLIDESFRQELSLVMAWKEGTPPPEINLGVRLDV